MRSPTDLGLNLLTGFFFVDVGTMSSYLRMQGNPISGVMHGRRDLMVTPASVLYPQCSASACSVKRCDDSFWKLPPAVPPGPAPRPRNQPEAGPEALPVHVDALRDLLSGVGVDDVA